jgi:hypothetical protein
MSGTQVVMERKAITVSGAAKYTIISTCTNAGTLQDRSIFLLNIVTPDDPKDDTFNRVIEIADILSYVTDRGAAIVNNDGVWRSSSCTLTYDDIETANAAWKELSSRISALVENYDAFLLEFETFEGGNVIIYPTVDESAKTALKDAYAATNTALTAANAARDAHSCADIEASIASTETDLQNAKTDLDKVLLIQAGVAAATSVYPTIYGTLNANNASVRVLNQASSATDSEIAAIEGYLVSNDSYLAQFNAQNTALSSLLSVTIGPYVTELQTRVSTLTQAKNALYIDLNNCRTEEASLQAAATQAQLTRNAALAAVIAVCPDFVP